MVVLFTITETNCLVVGLFQGLFICICNIKLFVFSIRLGFGMAKNGAMHILRVMYSILRSKSIKLFSPYEFSLSQILQVDMPIISF